MKIYLKNKYDFSTIVVLGEVSLNVLSILHLELVEHIVNLEKIKPKCYFNIKKV